MRLRKRSALRELALRGAPPLVGAEILQRERDVVGKALQQAGKLVAECAALRMLQAEDAVQLALDVQREHRRRADLVGTGTPRGARVGFVVVADRRTVRAAGFADQALAGGIGGVEGGLHRVHQRRGLAARRGARQGARFGVEHEHGADEEVAGLDRDLAGALEHLLLRLGAQDRLVGGGERDVQPCEAVGRALGPLPLQELADLAADHGRRLQKALVRRLDFPCIEHQHADRAAPGRDREAEGAAHSGVGAEHALRRARIAAGVGDPDRFA